MADSPYVGESTDKKEKAPEVDIVKAEGVKGMSLKYIAIVVTVLVVVMLLYYAVTCFSGNAKPRKKSAPKDVITEKTDSFSVEEEVDKLRTKQDEFKARL
jgi:hypothetical protein